MTRWTGLLLAAALIGSTALAPRAEAQAPAQRQAKATKRALTQAEQIVCPSLKSCLAILKDHDAQSFDYRVLAVEFGRFGPSARDALLKRIKGGDGHAADLLVEMTDRSAVVPLRAIQSPLARRTETALIQRLRSQKQKTRPIRTALPPINRRTSACLVGTPIDLSDRARQMPFFELDVARPDLFGAFRPSAKFDLPLPGASRGALSSALPVKGGWLAAYAHGAAGGLVFYDGKSGAPRALIDQPMTAILPRTPLKPGEAGHLVWGVSDMPDRIDIWDASPPKPRIVAAMPGRLNGLSRGGDGTIFVSSDQGHTMRLPPQGKIASGCPRGNIGALDSAGPAAGAQ